MFILDDILLAPYKGLKFIFKEIQKRAEAELYDESEVQRNLIQLQMAYEVGDLEKEEYEIKEEQLIERLRFIREYKELHSEDGEEQ